MNLSKRFRRHVGHHIECVCYGDPNDPTNVSIECMDCNEVLIDTDIWDDPPPWPKINPNLIRGISADTMRCIACGSPTFLPYGGSSVNGIHCSYCAEQFGFTRRRDV